MIDVKCKECAYYSPQIGIQEELSGQLEAETKPFGRCNKMDDPVNEDEWCGQFKARLFNKIANECHYDSEHPLESYAKLLSVINGELTNDGV